MDLLIFGGQSNMQGETEALPDPNPVVEGALEYRYLTDSLVPLCHPVGEDVGESDLLMAHKGHGSLIPAFCRAYVSLSGREAVAVHVAKGSTTLSQWLLGTHRYGAARDKMLAAIRKVRALGAEIGRIYYVWLQGESDALKKTEEDDYLRMLVEYKNALKADVGIDAFTIIRVGYFSKDHTLDEAIMRAQERAAADDPDFVMLTRICATLSLDPAYLNPFVAGHYSNKGMDRIGETAGAVLARLCGES